MFTSKKKKAEGISSCTRKTVFPTETAHQEKIKDGKFECNQQLDLGWAVALNAYPFFLFKQWQNLKWDLDRGISGKKNHHKAWLNFMQDYEWAHTHYRH